jgi:hypothetical protein
MYASISPMAEDRIRRLARKIEDLRRKDESSAARRNDIHRQRQQAAERLHGLCDKFVARVNALIKEDQLILVPSEFPSETSDECRLQFMINVRGRVLLIDLEPPPSLVSTELFRKPYILQGEVRFFNQELLDDSRVEENGLFFCPNEGAKDGAGRRQGEWLFWNGRTYKSGPVDDEYLAELMDQLM